MGKSIAVQQPDQLPAVIPEGYEGQPVQSSASVPYVVFAHPLNKSYGRIVATNPATRTGDPILLPGDPANPVRLPTLKYFLVGGTQYWGKFAKVDPFDLLEYSATSLPSSSGFTEVFETAAIVFVGADLLVPATIRFRGPQCPGVKGAYAALEMARTAEWLSLSDEHASTGAYERPWLRFTARTVAGNPKTGANGVYVPLEKANVVPTTGAEYKKVRAFCSDPAFSKMLNAVIQANIDRISFAKKKAV